MVLHSLSADESAYDERAHGVDLSTLEKMPQRAPWSPVPVTVVICVQEQAGMLGCCLDAVVRANPAEIIVVDRTSDAATAAIARAKGARVVSMRAAQLGSARQLGASLANHEYVVFVGADVVVEPDTFQLLVDEAQEAEYDALQAELRTYPVKPRYWNCTEHRWRRVQSTQGLARVLGYQITLVRRELLMAIGFDPAFEGPAEDFDFSFRAHAAGALIANTACTVAYREDHSTLREFVARRIGYGRGVARMLTRYGRSYLREAADQVNSLLGNTRVRVEHLPYLSISWSAIVLGIILELGRVAFDPALRRRLSIIHMVQHKADAC